MWTVDCHLGRRSDKVSATCTIGGVARVTPVTATTAILTTMAQMILLWLQTLPTGWMDFPETNAQDVYIDPCKSSGCGASELAGCATIMGAVWNYLPVSLGYGASRLASKMTSTPVQVRLSAFRCLPLSTAPLAVIVAVRKAESYYVTRYGCVSVTGWVQRLLLTLSPACRKPSRRSQARQCWQQRIAAATA